MRVAVGGSVTCLVDVVSASHHRQTLDLFIGDVLVERLSRLDAVEVFARPTVPPEEIAALRGELVATATLRAQYAERLDAGRISLRALRAESAGVLASAGCSAA